MNRRRAFRQGDVFSAEAGLGNPVAVVLDADGLDDEQMQRFARWTNLSETTFVLPATEDADGRAADYRLRIFTPGGELPFAGHPTLGSCAAWLATGGVPRGDEVVQQCGVGLVRIRHEGKRFAFAAPPLRRGGPLEPELLARVAAVLRVDPAAIVRHQWADNGPHWAAVMLDSAAAVLALQPDVAALGALEIGIVGPYPEGQPCRYEVRAFAGGLGVPEDPVTGSLNAALAQWLIGAGLAPERYVASQGTALGRAGRVHVERRDGEIWIGGECMSVVEGHVQF